MTETDINRETVLIGVCKANQGQYLLPGSGSGSWATTYSNEFIDAVCELFLLYKNDGWSDPLPVLARKLRDAGVRSCRGAEMTNAKVEYLYKSHLSKKIQSKSRTRKRN